MRKKPLRKLLWFCALAVLITACVPQQTPGSARMNATKTPAGKPPARQLYGYYMSGLSLSPKTQAGAHFVVTWTAFPAQDLYKETKPPYAIIPIRLRTLLIAAGAFRRQDVERCQSNLQGTVLDNFSTNNRTGGSYHQLVQLPPHLAAGKYYLVEQTWSVVDASCDSTMISVTDSAGR